MVYEGGYPGAKTGNYSEDELQHHLAVAAAHNSMPAAWARRMLRAKGINPSDGKGSQAANAAVARMQAQIDALTAKIAAFEKANPGVAVPLSPASA